jgi:hypothetical protein
VYGSYRPTNSSQSGSHISRSFGGTKGGIKSPFKDMQLSIKKKESSGREPFNAKDLRKILAKETFLNNSS